METVYLDINVIEQPFAAIHLAIQELSRMGEITSKMVVETKKAFLGNDLVAVGEVMEYEKVVNNLRDKITHYLASILAADKVTEHQAETISGLMHAVSDVEHIGDNCKNIAEFAAEKTKNGYWFSDTACAEIYQCFEYGTKMVANAIEALKNTDFDIAKEIKAQEKELNKLEADLRVKHMERLNRRECSPEFTVIYTDVVHNIEKIGDSCDNIANVVLDEVKIKKVTAKE
jgi:phosphate:Na+ symporter